MTVDITEDVPTGTARPSTTRKIKGTQISDYFEKHRVVISTSLARSKDSSAQVVTSPVASSSPLHSDSFGATDSTVKLDASECDAAAPDSDRDSIEYHKLTAGNGWAVARRLRIRPKKRVKRDAVSSSSSEDDDDETERTKTKTKTKSHCQGSRAKLGRLPSLPWDTLFEIFRHLLPIDILHLSRTTKEFRSLLLHRSATGLWKDALSNVKNVPGCPPELSLPFWVNLLFDKDCHKCLARNASKCIDFILCVRYCSKCVKTELSSEDEYNKDKKQDAIILRAVPFSRCLYGNDKRYCVKDVRDAFLKELATYPGDRTAFVEERYNSIKVRRQNAVLCKKWYKRMIQDRTEELNATRKSRQDAIREKLSTLGFGKELEFVDELERSWHGVCAVIPQPSYILFKDHDLVKQSKPLTDRTWANIKGTMVEYMEEMRDLRLCHERCLVIRQRRIFVCQFYNSWRRQPEILKRYPADSFMPGVADILEWAPALEFTQNADEETPLKEDMAHIVARLPEFISQFRFDIYYDLWRMSGHISGWDDFSSLAIVVFRCKNKTIHCMYQRNWLLEEGILSPNQPTYEAASEVREPCMWYPEYVFHPCCTTVRRPWEEEIAGENVYLRVPDEFFGCRRAVWNVWERLEFDEKASKTVKNLLDACGLDHKTRVDELDGHDYRFVCLKCSFGDKCDGERKVRVWTWRDAVHHNLRTHFGDAQVRWECISPEDTIKARELEKVEFIKRSYRWASQQNIWKCIACRDSSMEGGRMGWSELYQHFRDHPDHGDEKEMEFSQGILYYEALGYGTRERPPVKITPGKF